jgi:phenylacetate-CoA ligase/benzoylacetate-CoA ligase
MQQAQLGELPGLVERLVSCSPYYRRRLSGTAAPAGDLMAWLRDVPFTTKEDLREAQENLDADRPLGELQCVPTTELVQVITSSGTTGAPTLFGLTAADWRSWRHVVANVYWTAGVRRSSVVALTTGMAMVAGGLPYADGIRATGATLAWVGGQTTPRMAQLLQRLGVDVLVGTASFTSHFAEVCEQVLGRPSSSLAVRTVIGGGEPGLGLPEIRQRIATAWGASRVSEVMGLGDVLAGMWAECGHGHGMHFVAAPDVLVELIDPRTHEHVPWEDGAEGEAVYTTLAREATPVLRYRSRDHLKVTGTRCGCGRAAPTVRCVGRTDDMLIYKAMNVFPSAIRDVVLAGFAPSLTGAMRLRKNTADQVRFDEPIPLELEVTMRLDAPEVRQLVSRIEEAVREQLRVRVRVEPLTPGTIPVGAYKNALTYVADDLPAQDGRSVNRSS